MKVTQYRQLVAKEVEKIQTLYLFSSTNSILFEWDAMCGVWLTRRSVSDRINRPYSLTSLSLSLQILQLKEILRRKGQSKPTGMDPCLPFLYLYFWDKSFSLSSSVQIRS